MKKVVISLGSMVIIIAACSKSSTGMVTSPDCSGSAKLFATDVNPVIQSSCASNAGCHASGSSNGPGALITYQQIFNARFSIRSAVANGNMPLNSSLSVSQKNAILCWVDNGATNN
jgi:hypothetical protein